MCRHHKQVRQELALSALSCWRKVGGAACWSNRQQQAHLKLPDVIELCCTVYALRNRYLGSHVALLQPLLPAALPVLSWTAQDVGQTKSATAAHVMQQVIRQIVSRYRERRRRPHGCGIRRNSGRRACAHQVPSLCNACVLSALRYTFMMPGDYAWLRYTQFQGSHHHRDLYSHQSESHKTAGGPFPIKARPCMLCSEL